jgi:hypothetical protein
VRSGGKDEPIYIVFLRVLDPFVPIEQRRRKLDLLDRDDVRLAQETPTLGESGDAALCD